MRKTAKVVAILALLFGCAVLLTDSADGQTSNVWSSAGQMVQARTGAVSVLLSDGKILITGGNDGNGIPLASAEVFDPATGHFSEAALMAVPRASHAAIVLTSGDVLVTGGLTSGGGYSDSAEIFNAQTQSWTLLETSLGSGLAKHAMASLPDGNVLIVGGESTTGPVLTLMLFKIFDYSISPSGSLVTGRTNAVAAATPDGRVLIAGGTDINGTVLSSTEIFVYSADTMSGTVSAGPNMSFPRTNATATTTYDGVAVIGGNNGSVDLGSAEIFSQWTNAFRVVSGATPRSGHIAALLPRNGSILTMGGTGGVAVDLLQPWVNNLAGAFIAGASSVSDHNGGIAAPGSLGNLLAAGGTGASAAAAEIYWFPTISTDQPDYAPGTPVVMSGAGFQPGESVNLYLREYVNKMLVDPPDYNAVVDSSGRFTFTEYAPTVADAGARYHLTAVGAGSGRQAQTIFTDRYNGDNLTIGVSPVAPGNSVSASLGFNSACSTASCTNPNSIANGDNVVITATAGAGYKFSSWTASGAAGDTGTTCTSGSTSNPCMLVSPNGNKTTAVIAQFVLSTSLAVANATGPFGGSANLSATLSPAVAGKTISFTLNGSAAGSATTNASGVATVTANLTGINAGTYSTGVGASFVGDSTYAGTTGTGSLTVSAITPSFTNLTASQSISYGTASVTLSGKLTGSPINPPSGSAVKITINGVTTTTATTDAAGDFSTSVTTSSLNASTTPYAITYSYTATTNFAAASNATTALTVNALTPSFTNLTASQSITYGTGSVTLSGKLTASPVNPPSGSTVSIAINGVTTTTATADAAGNFSTSVTTSSLNASTTPYTITYSYAATANFGAASNASTALTVNKATASITVTPYNVTYDANAHTATATATGVNGVNLIANLTLTQTTHTDAGTYSTDAWSFTDPTANYKDDSGTVSDLINKATPTLSLACTEVTYDGQPHSCVGTAKGVGAVTVGGTWSYIPASETEAGSYPTTATFTSTDANYVSGGTASGTLKINPLALTLAAGSYSGVYDGSTHALSACSSTQPTFVTCTNNPAGPVGPDVNTVVVSPTAAYVQGSSGDYTITSNDGSWSITPLAVTVTGGNYSGIYDGVAHSPLACTSSYAGVSCTNNPNSVGPEVGSGPVAPVSKIESGIAADYVITATNGAWSISPLSLTLNAGSYSGVYDGSGHALSACASTQPSFVTCSNDPTGPVGPNVGSAVVSPSPLYVKGSSIDYTISSNNGSWSITALPVTVTGGNYIGIYDGVAHSPSACTSSYMGVSCTNNPNSVGPDVSSGAVAPESKIESGIAADYVITPKDGSWSISPLALTLTAGGYSGVYDGNGHALSACASTQPSFVTCSNDPTGPVGPNVGSAAVSPSPSYAKGSSIDYTITSNNGSWSITALAVTVTGGNYSGIYDGVAHSPSACTSSYSGVSCANNPNSIGPDVGSGAVAPVSSIVTGIAADYVITPSNGSWSISPLALTLTAGGYSGVYDGIAHALSACSSTQPSFVTCANNPAGPVGPDVNTVVVSPTPAYVQGSSGDYTITSNNGSWSITPLAVTVKGGSYSGTYDGVAHSPLACMSSYVGVSCTNNPNSIGPEVGSGAIAPVSKLESGIAADYVITATDGAWSISPLALTLTAGGYTGVYDGIAHALSACATTQPTFVTCSNNPLGPVGPHVGAGDVTPTVIYDKGSSIDYTITSNNGSWSITALAVTITGGSYSGTYDGNTHQASACGSTFAGVSCTNDPNSVGPDVGSGPIAPISKLESGTAADYVITPKDGSWSISPLTVTVTAGSHNGTYDGTAHAPSTCTSSFSGVSCTNSPNSVGPDVGSGVVTPASSIVTGTPADYTINPVNGAWSITALAVTVTGGSYSGTYDGVAHPPSPCTSSYAAGVSCSNSPNSVGPNVGSGAIAPVSSIVTGIPADYVITPTDGSWSISRLAVTITGGNYTGVYDGSEHVLSACSSSQQGFVTCTNDPTGPVGPDVGSSAVTPAPAYAKGSPDDYTITTNNGSWAITVLPVALTAGNYTGSFNNATHALSPCISTSPTLVTCTNNPTGPVGPGAGSGVVNPITGYLHGSAIDYSFTPTNGAWNISQVQAAFSGLANQSIIYGTSSITLTGVISAPGSVYPPSGETVSIGFNGSTVQTMIGANGVFSATLDTHAVPVSPSAYLITYNYAGDANFIAASTATTTLSVKYASGGICDGEVGHQILQPINADGTSVFNSKSTSPAKFRVCNKNGVSIGTPGVVSSFVLYQVAAGTVVTTVNEPVDSTTPDVAFRWDPSGQQWIFNISNKGLSGPNKTYYFLITLNDGSSIPFNYGLK